MNQPTDTLQRDATNRPLILISNDDGFETNGIRALVDFVKPLGDVLVCAPEGPRSGFSRAFSATDPLTLRRRDNMGEGVEVWSCSGTPVDCVKLAFDQFCLGKRLPDLVLGGINHGDNSTVNNHYSGTMGVAMEGCMKYIPSIAFSSCYYHPDANLEPLRPYVQEIVGRVLAEGLPKGICLNVNFPARQEFEGVRVCRMTYGRWVDEVMKRPHPRGYDYYWVVGSYQNDEPDARDSDQWALNHGFVAITPTNLDVTAYEQRRTGNACPDSAEERGTLESRDDGALHEDLRRGCRAVRQDASSGRFQHTVGARAPYGMGEECQQRGDKRGNEDAVGAVWAIGCHWWRAYERRGTASPAESPT